MEKKNIYLNMITSNYTKKQANVAAAIKLMA